MRSIGDQYFDEVGNWLRRYGFFNKYGELCKAKGIVQLKELSQRLSRADLKKVRSLNLLLILLDRE